MAVELYPSHWEESGTHWKDAISKLEEVHTVMGGVYTVNRPDTPSPFWGEAVDIPASWLVRGGPSGPAVDAPSRKRSLWRRLPAGSRSLTHNQRPLVPAPRRGRQSRRFACTGSEAPLIPPSTSTIT